MLMGEILDSNPRGSFEVFEGHGHFDVPLGDAILDSFWISGCNEWLADELNHGRSYSLRLQTPAWYKPIRNSADYWDPDSELVFARQDDPESLCEIQGTVCLAGNIQVQENDQFKIPALILMEASVTRGLAWDDTPEHENFLALPLGELPALLEFSRLPTIL